jgi:hypothetical protein
MASSNVADDSAILSDVGEIRESSAIWPELTCEPSAALPVDGVDGVDSATLLILSALDEAKRKNATRCRSQVLAIRDFCPANFWQRRLDTLQ